jgi:hypothetical protein
MHSAARAAYEKVTPCHRHDSRKRSRCPQTDRYRMAGSGRKSGRPYVGFGMKVLPAVRSADVRFWVKHGKHLLVLSFSVFGPTADLLDRECASAPAQERKSPQQRCALLEDCCRRDTTAKASWPLSHAQVARSAALYGVPPRLMAIWLRYPIICSISRSLNCSAAKPGICMVGQLRTDFGSRIRACNPSRVMYRVGFIG